MSRLAFHGPLSQARAVRLTERLTRNNPSTVLDIGCGWGELMLHILAAAPDASEQEWEEFESGYQADEEEWLAAHPDHPEAAEIRRGVDEHRSYWLRGYRGVLGFAYLTLVPVS